jgi:hypothetical protein
MPNLFRYLVFLRIQSSVEYKANLPSAEKAAELCDLINKDNKSIFNSEAFWVPVEVINTDNVEDAFKAHCKQYNTSTGCLNDACAGDMSPELQAYIKAESEDAEEVDTASSQPEEGNSVFSRPLAKVAEKAQESKPIIKFNFKFTHNTTFYFSFDKDNATYLITPQSYFDENGIIWNEGAIPNMFLPDGFTYVNPGKYKFTSNIVTIGHDPKAEGFNKLLDFQGYKYKPEIAQ